MKYYIATSLENSEFHNKLRHEFAKFGHEITYDWTTHGSVKHKDPQTKNVIAHCEVDGVVDADFVVVCLPGGQGTHVEIGLSIAGNRPFFIVSNSIEELVKKQNRICIFYHLARCWIFSNNPKQIAETIQGFIERCDL